MSPLKAPALPDPETGTRHSRPRGPPLGQSSEWGRELQGGRETEGQCHPPSPSGDGKREGATLRSFQHGERRRVTRGIRLVQFHRTTWGTAQWSPERDVPGSQVGSCSRRVGAAPGGQGSSRASTVRHVSDEKTSFCCHPMPCSPRLLSLKNSYVSPTPPPPEWSFKNELRKPLSHDTSATSSSAHAALHVQVVSSHNVNHYNWLSWCFI